MIHYLKNILYDSKLWSDLTNHLTRNIVPHKKYFHFARCFLYIVHYNLSDVKQFIKILKKYVNKIKKKEKEVN